MLDLSIRVEILKKYVSIASIVSQKIFSKKFVAAHETKLVLKLDKPIYVEFSILALNKFLMYQFHYYCTKRKLSANLFFTNADKLNHEIKTDVYEDFYGDKSLFDFSDYPRESKCFDPADKNVIGKIKDEFKGKIISEFVGLKSKMYSLVDVDGEKNKNAKGVNNTVIKNTRHK